MVGSLGRSLDAAFNQTVCETDIDDGYRLRHKYNEDVQAFCNDYKDDKLFEVIPGRYHPSYQFLRCDRVASEPGKLKARLIKYSRKIDRSRRPITRH